MAEPNTLCWNRIERVVIRSRTMEPCPPAVGTYKSLRQGHQRHIERGLVTRTRARPFKYSGSRPLSCRRRRRRAGRSAGRGRRMSRTAARCSSERSSSIPPGSTIRIEVVKCHRGRRDGLRKGSGKYSVEFPLSLVDGFYGPPRRSSTGSHGRTVGATRANASSMRMGTRRRGAQLRAAAAGASALS